MAVYRKSAAGVRADIYYKRTNRRVVFRIPSLEAGRFGLVLRRSCGGTAREGAWETIVSVN